MMPDWDISVLWLVLGAVVAGSSSLAAWYVVKMGRMDLTHPDQWARDTARQLARQAGGMAESEVRELCDAHVGSLFATNPRFRRTVRYVARRERLDPEAVLWAYRSKLRQHLLPSPLP